MPLGIATVLAAAVRQHTHELHVVALEQGDPPIIEQIGRRDRRLAVIQLGDGHLAVGVDEGLLIDAPDALHTADIEGVLRACWTDESTRQTRKSRRWWAARSRA